jgi:hypothetical protein
VAERKPIRYESGQLIETEPDRWGQYDTLANVQLRDEDDGPEIARRWNAHDDLYAACEAVETWIEDETLNDLDELSDDCKAILATVKAALAKARGEVARG